MITSGIIHDYTTLYILGRLGDSNHPRTGKSLWTNQCNSKGVLNTAKMLVFGRLAHVGIGQSMAKLKTWTTDLASLDKPSNDQGIQF